MNLSKNVKITKVAAAAVSAGTAVNGAAVDMQNFEGVLFFTTIATANAGNYIKAQQDTDVALGTVADLADSAVVATANAEVVFDAVVPEYLAGLVYGGVCESTASELAARRMAMDAATSNAEEMIDKLNLYYNRARQASITQEITEIVAGAEGL